MKQHTVIKGGTKKNEMQQKIKEKKERKNYQYKMNIHYRIIPN